RELLADAAGGTRRRRIGISGVLLHHGDATAKAGFAGEEISGRGADDAATHDDDIENLIRHVQPLYSASSKPLTPGSYTKSDPESGASRSCASLRPKLALVM